MKVIAVGVTILLGSVALAACVETRSPVLVDLKQPNDEALTCEQIATEYKVNTEVATNKISKNKSADGNEGNALLDRNVLLREIAINKNCGILQYPPQPERYS